MLRYGAGAHLASSEDDGVVHVLDIETQAALHSRKSHFKPVCALAVLGGGSGSGVVSESTALISGGADINAVLSLTTPLPLH